MDTDESVRSEASRALENALINKKSQEYTLTYLLSALKDVPDALKSHIVSVFGYAARSVPSRISEFQRVVPVLSGFLNHENSNIRIEAAEALVALGLKVDIPR